MAFKVTRIYMEQFPALRFIGKRYTNEDRVDGGFGEQWGDWWKNDLFNKLKEDISDTPYDEATIGLMTMRGDMSDFTYWIGLFYPSGTGVPTGFDFLDLPESNVGVGWVCGNEENGEIFGAPPHEAVCKKLEEEKMGEFRNDITGAGNDTYCFFERYNCPRFTSKDEDGNVTLDYGNYMN
jgi:hypothetical protein